MTCNTAQMLTPGYVFSTYRSTDGSTASTVATISSHPSTLGALNELDSAWRVEKEECSPFSSITNLIYLTCHIQISSIILYYFSLGVIEEK